MQVPGGRAADRLGARTSALLGLALIALGNAVSLPAPDPCARVPRPRGRRPRHGLRVRRRQRLHPRARRHRRSCRVSTAAAPCSRRASRIAVVPLLADCARLAGAVPQRGRRRGRLRRAARARTRRAADPAPRGRAARARLLPRPPPLSLRGDPRDVVRVQRDRRELGRHAARAPRPLEELRVARRLADAPARLLHARRPAARCCGGATPSRWVAASLVVGGLGAIVLALPLPLWALVARGRGRRASPPAFRSRWRSPAPRGASGRARRRRRLRQRLGRRS